MIFRVVGFLDDTDQATKSGTIDTLPLAEKVREEMQDLADRNGFALTYKIQILTEDNTWVTPK